MSFTRLSYDPQAYNEEVARSTNPLMYRLDPNYAANCQKCFAPYGPRNGQESADAVGQQIDVDSVLRGISKKHSNANVQQQPHSLKPYTLSMPPTCSNSLESEYTRYTYPSYDLKGLAPKDLRLDYPLHDPQCQIFENFAVNTRLQAKDNHRTIWQVPLTQKEALPKERPGQQKTCTVTLNCSYAPFQ